MPYVDAARAAGFGHGRIILRHMLPNVMAPYLIMLTAFLGQAILLEASLSFLGLGVQEPTAAWGLMLRGAAVEFAETAPWMAIFPGLAISLAVFAFNLFGDSLRDALDPEAAHAVRRVELLDSAGGRLIQLRRFVQRPDRADMAASRSTVIQGGLNGVHHR